MKPQLHVSMMNMLFGCGVQFQRRYGARFDVWHQEEILPPGIALAVGISVDKSVTANMQSKLATGALMPAEMVAGIARDSFEGVWQGGMIFTEDEAINLKKTKGDGIDTAVALAGLHADDLAPKIMPVAVQEKFVIHLDGYPYDLSGTKDIRESNSIRDTKTTNKTPDQDGARTLQMATYALAESVERALPEKVIVDYLVKNKVPKIEVRECVPDMQMIDSAMRRIERAVKIIEAVKEGKSAFTPASNDDWKCSQKWCGFALSCPFWSGR